MRAVRNPLRHAVGSAVVATLVLTIAACGSDGSSPSTLARTTVTTNEVTTTTPPPSLGSQVQSETAVWPFADRAQRFDDPVAAARSFAVDYLGFVDPVLSPFQSGDSRSGEVPIRPRSDGPVTTVFVRQLGPDDNWWVLGSMSPSLLLSAPEVLSVISSPVPLAGQSTAFEATITVEIRQDGTTDPLGSTFTMGGSMGEMGPFSTTVAFDAPTAAGGAVVLETRSAEDGSLWEASVVRVAFG